MYELYILVFEGLKLFPCLNHSPCEEQEEEPAKLLHELQ